MEYEKRFFVIYEDLSIGGGHQIETFEDHLQASKFIEDKLNAEGSQLDIGDFMVVEGQIQDIAAEKVATRVRIGRI